jgi:GYF domain 2
MYKIIGADQKEYGPITAEQIQQWIRDGRVNAQTQARLEPGGNWQPLSAFPEFAATLQPGVAAPGQAAPAFISPLPGAGGSRDAALRAVKGPAICLIAMSALGIVLYLFSAVLHMAGNPAAMNSQMGNMPPQAQAYFQLLAGPVGTLIDIAVIALNALVLFGAIKMLRLESRPLATTACILGMLPVVSCCCLIGLPFGIWGLVVLNKPEVRSHFT